MSKLCLSLPLLKHPSLIEILISKIRYAVDAHHYVRAIFDETLPGARLTIETVKGNLSRYFNHVRALDLVLTKC